MKRLAAVLLLILMCVNSACVPPPGQFNIYLLTSDSPVPAVLDAESAAPILESAPLITPDDIITYSRESHIIQLTAPAMQRIKNLTVSVYGKPFAVCLDRQPVYCGKFMSLVSSVSTNMTVIMQPMTSEMTDTIRIQLGYPAYFFTDTDPRPNPDILISLENAGKLK